MQRFAQLVMASSTILVLGCEAKTPLEVARGLDAPALAKGGGGGGGGTGTEFATRTSLPALNPGVHGEAYAIDRAGTLIGGYSWDQKGRMHPVTWSLVNGSWQITAYQWDATATSAVIRGINDNRDKAGTFWPASAPRAVIWNAAGFTVLGCNELGEAYGISSGAQVVVGTYRSGASAIATVWKPGQCRETLPALVAGGGGVAYAVNGDGTIVGGQSAGVPVRWRRVGGSWQVDQLDSRRGTVFGANSAGDLVGAVGSACSPSPTDGCSLDVGIVWSVGGGLRVLPTLGGTSTTPRAINSAREVVGLSALANGNGFPFIWSETLGIRQLPVSDGAWAFTISDVRADGTRLVAGAGGRPFSAQVWVVRNP